MGDYLTTADVCSLLSRTPLTLRRWVKSGFFPMPLRLRNRLLWKRSDVEAFLQRLKAGGPTAP
jgi:predicted DNA-binding transcriptional regulator AlpA